VHKVNGYLCEGDHGYTSQLRVSNERYVRHVCDMLAAAFGNQVEPFFSKYSCTV
jgi:hypothetical protein